MKNKKHHNKKVFLHTEVVCERRKLDSQIMAQYFKKNSFHIVSNPKKADIIILVTCGADDFSADRAFNAIEKFKKFNAELIIAGCLPETDHDKFHISYNGKYIITKNLKKIDEYFPLNEIKFYQIDDANKPWINFDNSKIADLLRVAYMNSKILKKVYCLIIDNILKLVFCKSHLLIGNLMNLPTDDMYFIQISRGCLGNCSYCSIKNAVGKFHSKSLEDCIKETKAGVKKGVKKIYLTAEDTGAYGQDIGKTFPELLNEIIEIKGDFTIEVYALNPVWVVKYIDQLEEIVKSGKITGLCIPIQSGSSNILKKMNRYSNIGKIKEALTRLKKANPSLNILTHVIIGFPTETREEYKESLNFLRDIKFDSGLLIPMSVKKHTEAENIEPRICEEEIMKRLKYGRKFLKSLGYNIVKGGYFGRKTS